jgi:hypothetical protein
MISGCCVARLLSAGRDARLYGSQDACRYDDLSGTKEVRRDGFAGQIQHLPANNRRRRDSTRFL